MCIISIIEFYGLSKKNTYHLWIFWGCRFTLLYPPEWCPWVDRLHHGRQIERRCHRLCLQIPLLLITLWHWFLKQTTIWRTMGRSVTRSCFMRFDQIKNWILLKTFLTLILSVFLNRFPYWNHKFVNAENIRNSQCTMYISRASWK